MALTNYDTPSVTFNSLENIQFAHDGSDFKTKLEQITLKVAIQHWLGNLRQTTRRNYSYYVADLIKRNIIPDPNYTVGQFNKVPHEMVIDHIKKVFDWSEGTRQLKAACYISLTAYLERISNGWFRKAIPSTLSANPTFYQVRDKCATNALTLEQWHKFIAALSQVSARDALIARCMFQGAKRVSEALSLQLEQVNFKKNSICFRQQKTGGIIKDIPITYPVHFMDELKEYIAATSHVRRNSQLFLTRTGKPIVRSRINYSFAKASAKAGLEKVTPHVLRATWVTLIKQQGVQDTEIMKVTGHTSSKMIYAYDKTAAEENYSKKAVLI